LQKAKPLKAILYEIIKEYHFTAHQADEVLQLLKSESGKYIASPTHKIIKNRKWIIIAPNNAMENSLLIISESDKEVAFANGKLIIDAVPVHKLHLSTDINVATLDAAAVAFPLLLRKWKKGDYFYPFGMHKAPGGKAGKKKLSRFFIDQKMSLIDKDNVWVLESNKKIAWIIGKRIDDRFKITTGTHKALVISFKAL
jgi:tRNA(Ile)-lysidine synthase